MNSMIPKSAQSIPKYEQQRLRFAIRGAVQGVGFRPFVYRLAQDLELRGYVTNTSQGVIIEIEASQEALDMFRKRLISELPPRAFVQSCEVSQLDPVGYSVFEIRASVATGGKSAYVLPDIATCPDCLGDIRDPSNRRFRYPFTNCTNCGPRYTIIESLPYDRANTTMKKFVMCQLCREEYENPSDRRFHAQPNACPDCGPQLEWWDGGGAVQARKDEALLAAADAIKAGDIVAVKGLGGFHLMVDARNRDAIMRLRERKHRSAKPFALMFPTLESVEEACELSAIEQCSLTSVESPIVLLRRLRGAALVDPDVAPGNPYLGVMLPYTPLHHLLMQELGFPVVATSANLAEEPICTDEFEALRRLAEIADSFLVHDRPIRRHVDDSIVRIVAGREQVTRRARGYAPLPITLSHSLPSAIAVGAQLKNSVALSLGRDVFVSQHIGDLETAEAYEAFVNVLTDLPALYDVTPEVVACDLHPDYLSTRKAHEYVVPVLTVQHQYAHILSCMADNEVEAPVLGIAWDGTGLGPDGSIWGGEFLQINDTNFRRVAHLRTFPLPGGDSAIREPRRSALGVLFELYGERMFDRGDLLKTIVFNSSELSVMRGMLSRQLNAPLTSSAGRLFDAVASLLGLCQRATFEGEAAMALEFAIGDAQTDESYPFEIVKNETTFIVDWQPLVESVLAERDNGTPVSVPAAKFHNALVEMMIAVAREFGQQRIVISGGSFQNRYLTEHVIARLRAEGFQPYWHQRIPPNDGGIALGQIVAAARTTRRN